MTEKKYSRIYKGESGRRYRYDYENCMLQWVETNPELIKEFGEVADQTGLSLSHWKSDKKAWIQTYDDNLSEELGYLSAEFEAELKAGLWKD